jgi:hypothetical protein
MRSGDFGSDGQHDAFGEAFRPRTPRRDLDHLDTRIGDTRIGQHPSNEAANCPARSRTRNRNRPMCSPRFIKR